MQLCLGGVPTLVVLAQVYTGALECLSFKTLRLHQLNTTHVTRRRTEGREGSLIKTLRLHQLNATNTGSYLTRRRTEGSNGKGVVYKKLYLKNASWHHHMTDFVTTYIHTAHYE